MTTPQPSNQPPEEVKPSAITPSSFIVYPLWLWHDETGEALPRGWTRRHHGTFSGTGLLNMGFTHWHPDQPTAPTGTPYLAPRPPAPVDAGWAKRANEAIAGIDYAMDWKNNSPSAVEFATGLAAARQFIIDARHAPADSASAQLAALREENERLNKENTAQSFQLGEATRGIEWQPKFKELQAQLAAAQSEVGRLTKERDGLDAELERMAGQPGSFAERDRLMRELATLRRERDELRAELLTTHQMACRVGLERDELAKLLAGGAGRIARERHRHVTQEGYDAAHDDEHTFGTIRVVAAMLACQGTDASVSDPLDRDNWNLGRHPLERRLEIAGALLAAELDRLERDSARAKQGEGQPEDAKEGRK